MKLAIVASLFLVAVGGIVGVGLWMAEIPVLKFHELTAPNSSYVEGDVQLDNVTVVAIESRYPLRFTVAPEGTTDVPVTVASRLSPPENFDVGKPVSLRGTYDRAARAFDAYQIMTKCPSRYKASDAYSDPKGEPAAAGRSEEGGIN